MTFIVMAEDKGNWLYHREKVQGAGVIISEDRFEPNFIRWLMVRIRESDGTNETHLESANSANGPQCGAQMGRLEVKDEYIFYASTDDEHHLETILTGFTQMSV